MTVFILIINNYPCRDNTLIEVFASRDKAIARSEQIYSEETKKAFVCGVYVEEEQGIYSFGWKHITKGQYQTEGVVVERELQ